MKPIVKTITALSDDADGIAQAQSLGGAGSLTLNGALVTDGVAILGAAQQIEITSVGNDSGIDWTVTGTDANGNAYNEVIDGANAGTATTGAYFKTVTDISADGATAGNVTSGVTAANGAVSPVIRVNRNQVSSFKLGLFVELSTGAVANYTVQHSPDWPESGDYLSSGAYAADANWYDTDGLTSLTATDESNIVIPVETVRLFLNSYTSGTAKLTVQQNY